MVIEVEDVVWKREVDVRVRRCREKKGSRSTPMTRTRLGSERCFSHGRDQEKPRDIQRKVQAEIDKKGEQYPRGTLQRAPQKRKRNCVCGGVIAVRCVGDGKRLQSDPIRAATEEQFGDVASHEDPQSFCAGVL